MTKVHYSILLDSGEVFDTSEAWGAPFDLDEIESPFPQAVMSHISELGPGETSSLTLSADEAYGVRDEELVFSVERKKLPSDFSPELGAVLSLTIDEEELLVTVIRVEDELITLDANHPLAGQTVTFQLELVDEE